MSDINKKRLTIALVIPNMSSGGAQRVLSTLANELVIDFDIIIITFIKNDPFYSLDNRITHNYCVDQILPSRNLFQATQSNFILLRQLYVLCKTNNVDLLIGFLTTANILTAIVAKFINVPSVICERNNPNLEKLGKVWRVLRKITYKWSSRLVVQTNLIKEYYEEWISQEHIKILPNPISRELSSKRDTSTRKEKVILNIGRLSRQKGQDMLIKAFARTENEDWKLIIIGEGELRKEYESLISELELGDKVYLLGRKKNIYAYYNKASIFAFSSNYEGFPNALIEAMHFGLPCISTDCPTGPSDLIKNDDNGFLVPVGDEVSFAKKLNLIMNNDLIRTKFSKQAPKAVRDFEANNVIQKWKCMLYEVL